MHKGREPAEVDVLGAQDASPTTTGSLVACAFAWTAWALGALPMPARIGMGISACTWHWGQEGRILDPVGQNPHGLHNGTLSSNPTHILRRNASMADMHVSKYHGVHPIRQLG